ncbi:hypothetical protein POM88_031260 [Heracleum sosnowskyi]|uniref:Uncharacterized protein n=1 Tax=Heracleum sosnowskyi TaxID=360622 RepID=A0AAD8HXG3_9APIA|nr:hypothetical protein POM88_031259 [Heracleum sosnowskyi]KAK1375067.1 hypothetical protein POM88_031260 [Heracleum sosnowskyi]
MGLLKACGVRLAGYGPAVGKKLQDLKGTVNLVGRIGVCVAISYPFVQLGRGVNDYALVSTAIKPTTDTYISPPWRMSLLTSPARWFKMTVVPVKFSHEVAYNDKTESDLRFCNHDLYQFPMDAEVIY